MRTRTVALVATLALGTVAQAGPPPDQPAAQEKTAALKDFEALRKEYDAAQQEFRKAYQAARTDDERQKAYAKNPNPEEWAARFRKIADGAPKDPGAAEALAWIAQNCRTPDVQAGALDALLANHFASPVVGRVAQSLQYSSAPNAQEFLRALLEKSKDHEAQGRACYTLAKLVHGDSQLAARLKESDEQFRKNVESWYGKERVERLLAADPAALGKEAEALLERVAKDFSDLKWGNATMAEKAKADLFEIRNLAVGMTAPEIEGEDQDGVRFKLSDHRGKVVLLDFWGFW